jgi:hypothetical protein
MGDNTNNKNSIGLIIFAYTPDNLHSSPKYHSNNSGPNKKITNMKGIENAIEVESVFFRIGIGLSFLFIALETSAKKICDTEEVTNVIGALTYLNIIANKPSSVSPKEKVMIQKSKNCEAKMSVKACSEFIRGKSLYSPKVLLNVVTVYAVRCSGLSMKNNNIVVPITCPANHPYMRPSIPQPR